MPRILAVIPARAGSKRLKGKNLRPVTGVPLLGWAVHLANAVADETVVLANDPAISAYAATLDATVLARPDELERDSASVDDVMAWSHSLQLSYGADFLLTIQPTSGTVDRRHLYRFVEWFEQRDDEAAVMAVEDHHITWATPATRLFPTRHPDESVLREIGVRLYRDPRSTPSAAFPIPGDVDYNALDINSLPDLQTIETHLTTQTVVFEFGAGSGRWGAGHLNRCILLANELQDYKIMFVAAQEPEPWIVDYLDSRGWAGHLVPRKTALIMSGVWVMDMLDTNPVDVAERQGAGFKVVTFEDHGPGATQADATINAFLDPKFSPRPNEEVGVGWAVIDPAFRYLDAMPVKRDWIGISFGGSDTWQLTEQCFELLHYHPDIELEVHVVPPPGRVSKFPTANFYEVVMHSKLLVCGGGRTGLEAAAAGTPHIVIPQHPGEQDRVHHHYRYGAYRLDPTNLLDLPRVVGYILDHAHVHAGMTELGRKHVDGKGARRVAHLIEGMMI